MRPPSLTTSTREEREAYIREILSVNLIVTTAVCVRNCGERRPKLPM